MLPSKPALKDIPRYITQSLLATAVVIIILLVINCVSNPAVESQEVNSSRILIIASLGSSAFTAFAAPKKDSSRPRFLIGGYIAGCLSGICMNFFNKLDLPLIPEHYAHIIPCALAVGLAMFLMVILKYQHPPAAALAMGLTLEDNVFMATMLSIIVVFFSKIVFRKCLDDLIE